MTEHHHALQAAIDGGVFGVLASAPIWGAWLADLNMLLTSGTLLCGMLVGIGRLILLYREWRKSKD
jgi:hypothetical protein